MKTDTTSTATPPVYSEPTHDEIALSAFLIWEKDGRQPGREMTYWLQAEAQLRAAKQKRAAALAKPQPARTIASQKATKPEAPKLTTRVARETTLKPKPSAKSASQPARRTSLKSPRQ